jgi:hypothetical protein
MKDTLRRWIYFDRRLDEIKINQGRILSELQRTKQSDRLLDYEFKVFSQWGEDGILQRLIANLDIANHTFIEFGVEDFFESNCRFLLMKDVWQGYVIDGSTANIERLKSSYMFWRYPLNARAAFITRENVAGLLDESGFDKEVGILSIDVDGIDYYLLEALEAWHASIVVVEYNSLFGADRQVSVPYESSFQRRKAHWSNLYWGASLPAFAALLDRRGYALVGVNSMGSNAFFVRRDVIRGGIKTCSVAECFRESMFREGIAEDGRLTYATARASGQVIADLPLVDFETGCTIQVGDVLNTTL